ncbi:MAG: AsmA-like C-terminal region-containing protein [Chitinophagales bacterium]
MKKALIGIGVAFLLLIGAVVAIPFLFKDQINNAVKIEINKNLDAKVDYADYSVSLLRSFPNLSFTLSDFSITGTRDFKGDTLIFVKDFRFVMDIMTVIRSEKYKVLQLSLIEPRIHALSTKLGKSNWDIVKKGSDSNQKQGSTNFSLAIKKYEIRNGWIVYNDEKAGTFASLLDLNFEGSGDVEKDIYQFNTSTNIAGLTYKSGAVTYLNNAKIDAKNDVEVNTKESKYIFKENKLAVNDLELLFDGFVQTKSNSTDLDVRFKSPKSEFKSILSLIPSIYKKDFSSVKTSGSLALSGNVKGTYSENNLPEFHLNLDVSNGMFQYPSLPTAVNNINLNARINKPQGVLDLMLIDIPKLGLTIGTDPITASINIRTPISDPNVIAMVNGRLNLAQVPKFYPIEGLKTLTGLLIANINFKGRMSDVQKKNYTAIQAGGTAKVSNLIYDSKETPLPVKVSDLQLVFNPKNVTVNNLDAQLGHSDLHATGAVDNFIGYAFGKGDLEGQLTLQSRWLDVNEILKDDSGKKPAAATEATGQKYFEVPKHIAFNASTSIEKITYDKMTLSQVHGAMKIAHEAIDLSGLSANLLGGSANISANYSTLLGLPKVSFNYDIRNFDFQQTYKAVDMAQKIAPVVKYVQGNFSSNLSGLCSLNEDMSVNYSSLNANGKVQIPTAKVTGLPIIDKIAEVTKAASFRNPEITNAYTVIKVHDGKVDVEPTDFRFGNGYLINVSGSNGFDQSIQYVARLDVPSKELGPAANALTSKIPKIPGVDFKLPETINVFLNIGGTVTKPTVGIGKVGGSGNSAKDMAKDVANQLKQKAEDEAKKQADALKQQAQQEAARLQQEAEKRAKDAADKAAKDAADKLKDAAKNVKWPWER